jgi:two-component system sensor histidine kinase PilS (NtrC family)
VELTAADSVRSSAGDGPLSFFRRHRAFEERLVVLMAARLALAVVSLGISLALDTSLGDVEGSGWRGLYGTVALAFLATAITGFALPHVQRLQRFAVLHIAIDIAIVTSLVHFSGGPDSVFAFLYVVVALYGALLFERRGGLISAGLGTASYGAVLWAAGMGWGGALHDPGPAVLLALWLLHTAAILTVAILASYLTAEVRHADEALRQRTSDLQRLANLHERTVESLMSGLLTANGARRITSFNPEAERITGLSRIEALGCDVEEVLPGVRDLTLPDGGARPGRARVPYRNRRGEDLHVGIGAYVLTDGAGTPSGHVVIFQDVTEVVAMEHELRRSERLAAVGELSAGIAHEIRNPLAAISGSVQMLRREAEALDGAHTARRLMDIVLRETDRLNRLITDLLDYARPAPLAIASVDVGEIVQELLEIFEPAAPAGVRVVLDVPASLRVAGDSAQLRQILWNLALNACQAMPEGGELAISARPAGEAVPQEGACEGRNGLEEKKGWVEICVRDDGTGMAGEVLDHVFDPFFTTKSEGSGLGLATVHRIVEEHGGSIRIESSVGSGTRVRIRLRRMEGDR